VWNKENKEAFKDKFTQHSKRQQEIKAAKEGLKQAYVRKMQNVTAKQIENQIFKNQFEMENMKANQRKATNRAMRIQNQANIRQTLDEQLKMKKKMEQQNFEQDKLILADGVKNEEKITQQRHDFLNKLRMPKRQIDT
jgi:hypothetical protein